MAKVRLGMDNSQSRTTTLYANGIIVGEVEVTGDTAKDMEVARQFLRNKGLYKETTLVQAMFRQAVSFATTAAHLHRTDLLKAPGTGSALHLRGQQCVQHRALSEDTWADSQQTTQGHELLNLFESLPVEAHQSI